jgi:hypothetical protein
MFYSDNLSKNKIRKADWIWFIRNKDIHGSYLDVIRWSDAFCLKFTSYKKFENFHEFGTIEIT